MKMKWKKAVENTPAYSEKTYCGKGIVIPAGGVYYLTNAYINLHMLRDSGCQLPVEIWYIGTKEIVPAIMDQLTKMGAVCKDITEHFSHSINGYEVKIHSIIASSFEEVMLLDADNVVFQNPEFLFDSPEYIKTGALFWPDIQGLKKNNLLWTVLDLPPQNVHGQESGQLVINKKKCWAPLYLCLHMNKKSQFYYQHVWGDKDTFQLSWKALGYPFHMMKHIPGILKNNFLSKTHAVMAKFKEISRGLPYFATRPPIIGHKDRILKRYLTSIPFQLETSILLIENKMKCSPIFISATPTSSRNASST